MKTGCYFTYSGPGRIGITVGRPRGIRGYRLYSALAPRRAWLNLPYPAYRQLYFTEILAPLCPNEVEKALRDLASPHEPVLLCYERPPFTDANWCHRRMVAEWFHDEIGLEVPEL